MEIYSSVDHSIRKVLSVLYRILLIAYSIALIAIYENAFEIWTYAAGFSIYIVIYVLLFGRDGVFGVLRLILDHLFIFFILYEKNVDELEVGTLLMIPIFNYLNHSSSKGPNALPWPLFIVTILTYCLLKKGISLYILLPITAVFMVNSLHSLRRFSHNLVSGLFNSVDDFYDSPNTPPFEIIKNFRRNMKFFRPDHITCFYRKGEKQLNILAGSRRIANFQIYGSDFYELLDENTMFVFNEFVINEKQVKEREKEKTQKNVVAKVDYAEREYVFLFENTSFSYFLDKGYYKSIIYPALTKIVKILDFDFQVRKQKRIMLGSVKKYFNYIDNAVKAVHFLNNKMNPVKNYFWMHKQLTTIDASEKAKLRSIEKLIENERDVAARRVDMIIERTNSILDKSYNPILASSLKREKIYFLLYIIRAAWYENDLDHDLIRVYWTEDDIDNKITVIDKETFSFILEEIIDNLKEHKANNCAVIFDSIGDDVLITFENDFNDRKRDEVEKVVSDFNEPGINEIMKRDSHGISFIKYGLDQMGVEAAMNVDSNLLKLEMTFKANQDEGSSI